MNIAHRKVPLGEGRIEFDYCEGRYRLAYYGFLYSDIDPKKIVREVRTAAMHPDLRQVLLIVLGEADAPHDVDTVEYYMRHQPWGRELP